MAESIRGNTALITGAARRIGRATALALAEEGVNIVAHYNTAAAEAASLCAEVEALGVQAWPLQADFSRREEIDTLIERALETAGTLDMLVNNASIFPQDSLQSVTLESLQENMAVNAWTPFVLGRSFAAAVATGKIVNMLDSRLHGYDWTHVGYIISKHAFAALTRMMALDFAPRVTVNAVAPGLILPPPGKDERYIDSLIHTVPLQRHGSLQDIADAIVYLLKAPFVTGEVLFVDGGRHLMEYSQVKPH